MGIKTVCEDVFGYGYKQALKEENPPEALERQVKQLEEIVHSMRLFQYLTLIAKELGLELTEPRGDFSSTFRHLLEEVLGEFYNRYGEQLEDLDAENFKKLFLEGASLEIGRVEDYIEDLIILLLAFLVDRTLSEPLALSRIRGIIRERQGKNLPLL